MKPLKFLLCLSVALAVSSSTSSLFAKPALAFSVAQGFPNDLVALALTPQGDAAITNTISVIGTYRINGYDAYALVNPQVADKNKLIHLLDRLKSGGIPFVFDMISSDTLPDHLGNAGSGNAPASADTGMALWNNWPSGDAGATGGILYYLTRYQGYLRGFRVHEPEWVFQRYQTNGWNYWDVLSWIESFVVIAQGNGLWVQYNSSVWDCHYAPPPTAEATVATKNSAVWLTAKYPGIIYPSYATNDGTYTRRLDPSQSLASWKSLVSMTGARGIGLSDQSWMTGMRDPNGNYYTENNVPVSALVAFISNAQVDPTASLIQFEPYWYFFNWTGGNSWTDGSANLHGNNIAWAFGIALPYH